MAVEAGKPDCLQVLSDRLQQLSDISSRFDALTKETDEKLHNVTRTANVLQNKMTPINEQMESLRHRRKAFEACKLFLEQTSSYQSTTEKYIKDLHQTKINSVDDYVYSLTKAKESLDFFSKFLPQEKTANNLELIVSEGSKNLASKFKELLIAMTDAEKLSPEKCASLAGTDAASVASHLPTHDKKLTDDLCQIAAWLDRQSMSSVYLASYADVRSLALQSTIKRLRDSLLGVSHSALGASPLVSRKTAGRETPIKTRTLPRRNKSRHGAQPALGSEAGEQPELDHEDLNVLIAAFVRLCQLEFKILDRFPFKVDKPQLLADQLVTKAKDFLVEDIRKFAQSVRREFRQDPESLLRLVSVLDKLRQLRPEMATTLAPCSVRVRGELEDVAKEMRSQAHSNLEDYRDDIVTDGGAPVRPLPNDGTVHELTLQALKFLQQLHDYELTTYEVLARDSTAAGDRRSRCRVIGQYLSKTVANLLRTLDVRSEQYSDPVLRSIFLLNNYRYVHQRLDRGKMTATIEAFNCEAVRFFKENQLKHRENYLNKGLERCAAPLLACSGGDPAMVGNARAAAARRSHRQKHADVVKLSEKEKALIKEKFKSFNEEFMAAYKAQSNYSVPDSELRKELIRENKDFLLDKYAMFRDKYSNVPFTSKKDKYIKFSRDDIERMLDEFFRGE